MNRANLPVDMFEELRFELKDHRSLQDLLRWAEEQPEEFLIPGTIAELIVQDEFTHDLVVPWQGYFLIYGTT